MVHINKDKLDFDAREKQALDAILLRDAFQSPNLVSANYMQLFPKERLKVGDYEAYHKKWWGDNMDGKIFNYQNILKKHGINAEVIEIKVAANNLKPEAALRISRSGFKKLSSKTKEFWMHAFGKSWENIEKEFQQMKLMNKIRNRQK